MSRVLYVHGGGGHPRGAKAQYLRRCAHVDALRCVHMPATTFYRRCVRAQLLALEDLAAGAASAEPLDAGGVEAAVLGESGSTRFAFHAGMTGTLRGRDRKRRQRPPAAAAAAALAADAGAGAGAEGEEDGAAAGADAAAGARRRDGEEGEEAEVVAAAAPGVDAVVGSSFGSALLVDLMARGVWTGPAVLLCPAVMPGVDELRFAANVRGPVVVVWGTQDEVVREEAVQALVDANPDVCTLVKVKGARHALAELLRDDPIAAASVGADGDGVADTADKQKPADEAGAAGPKSSSSSSSPSSSSSSSSSEEDEGAEEAAAEPMSPADLGPTLSELVARVTSGLLLPFGAADNPGVAANAEHIDWQRFRAALAAFPEEEDAPDGGDAPRKPPSLPGERKKSACCTLI